MKKAITLLIFAIVILTLIGCGGSVVGKYTGNSGTIELMANGNYLMDVGRGEPGEVGFSVAGPYKVDGDEVQLWFEQNSYSGDIDISKTLKPKGEPTRICRIKENTLIDTKDNTIFVKGIESDE